MADWTFFTNHAHVLLCIARDSGIRIRDLADQVGVTERAAQRLVAELIDAGYLDRTRDGRRNRYQIRADLPLRHPVEQPHRVGEILAVLTGGDFAVPGGLSRDTEAPTGTGVLSRGCSSDSPQGRRPTS